MGIDSDNRNRNFERILFIDAPACGLESLVEIQRPKSDYRFTHVEDLPQALRCLAGERFGAILWCCSAAFSEAAAERLLGLKPEDIYESSESPPVICVLEDNNHEGVARVLGHTLMGFVFASQLRSEHAATILGALIKRVSHEQLLEGAQQQLVNTEKFAAMGLLAAEVAHEINNPASFVISNLSVMKGYFESISEFWTITWEGVRDEAPELFARLVKLSEEYEIEFLQEDLDELLRRNLHGMQRIHQIVQDLRFFLHDSHGEAGWVNVERLLETTLNLVKYEAKFRARFELDFCGEAEILSDANRLSQVFLNVMVNAIHAIEQGDVEHNTITVSTQREEQHLTVLIRDTGSGIKEQVMEHIFEPFFTTKNRGNGSGLGLSISRDIVQSLGGEISVRSVVGEGSVFGIRLPVRAPKFERDAQRRGGYPPVDSDDFSEFSEYSEFSVAETSDTDTPEDK